MSKYKYQVWEGEMEVQQLDESEVTFITVIFSSMLGILLFTLLLCKTGFNAFFGLKRIEKRRRADLATIDY